MSCAFLRGAAGQVMMAAAKNWRRRGGESAVRPPVIPTSAQVPRPRPGRDVLEDGVAKTIDDDAREMHTVARDGT